jgi:hypothetical protein
MFPDPIVKIRRIFPYHGINFEHLSLATLIAGGPAISA